MIVSAGRNETFPFAMPIGVGLIESTMNLTRLALFNKPPFLLFIGSAGSYGEFKTFDIVESTSAANIETGFFSNSCYTPIDNVVSLETKGFNNQTIVNSSNYITTDINVGKSMTKHGIGIENMEFYALLQVAKEFEIPVAGIFVITNNCDKNAHEDFKKNHNQAIDKLIQNLIKRGLIKEKDVLHETI